jgi:hypothetical protein
MDAAGVERPSLPGSCGASEPSLQIPETKTKRWKHQEQAQSLQPWPWIIFTRLFPDGFAYRSKQNASEELAVHHGGHEVSRVEGPINGSMNLCPNLQICDSNIKKQERYGTCILVFLV